MTDHPKPFIKFTSGRPVVNILKLIDLKRMGRLPGRLLGFPGIESKILLERKNTWIATLASFFAVLCITLSMIIFDPSLKILIAYGLSMMTVQFSFIVTLPLTRGTFRWHTIVASNFYILATFAAILKLGGIPHSAGLIFVPFAAIFFTLPLQMVWFTTELVILYVATIILSTVFQPYLRDPGEISPMFNSIMYGINITWMSVLVYSSILQFFRQNKKIDQLEKQKLRELDEVKTRLFTNITHEFRTPLTIILGMADLIRENPAKWVQEGTSRISSSGQGLLHLVNQMLSLSRLEAEAMPVQFRQADIIVFLGYLAESFTSLATSRGISLKFEPQTKIVVMDYDPDKVLHIISNLVSNAIKFTPEGGTVVLTAGLVPGQSEHLEIRVKDNGCGIPADQLPHIFERFYRAESSGAGGGGGTGLGLAVVREMVRLLDGTIEVESLHGENTMFTVRLPVTNRAPLKETLLIPEIKEAVSGLRSGLARSPAEAFVNDEAGIRPLLLIVEDSPDVVGYLRAILNDEYEVMTAANGRAGLDLALANIPDIVICDVMMPVMDGIALLGLIKNDFRTSHIPVVMLTAKADIASRLRGIERGADAYLAKPFNREELLAQLRNLVDSRQKLQRRYASMEPLAPSADRSVSMEDAFILKVRAVLEEHLDDDRFGIHELCLAVGMSRAQMYRKFRSLTDKTVNEYIRSFRLFKARELLLTGGLTVSEAACETGFKNLSHFSRVFTEEFGRNPSEISR